MLDQERIPFDLDGKDISAGMNYVPSQKAYDGHLDFTPLTIAYRNAPPMQAEMHVGFLLRAGETEIKSLKLSTGNSRLEASGTIRNYNNPEITLQYQASLDLAEVGKNAKLAAAPFRPCRAEGSQAAIRTSATLRRETLSVRDLEWRDADGAHLRRRCLLALFRNAGQNCSFAADCACVRRHGAGRCCRSRTGIPRRHRERKLCHSGEQPGSISLEFKSAGWRQLFPRAKMPLDKIELAGNVSGDINSSWTGSLERAISYAEAGSISTAQRHLLKKCPLPRNCRRPITAIFARWTSPA